MNRSLDPAQMSAAAFGGALTQDQRLVKLHTVLGPDALVAERFDIEESIGPQPLHGKRADAGLRGVVHALGNDAHLELKQLVGQPALVELLTQASRTELRPFHGYVTEAAMVGSDGGLARFRLVIEPWLSLLSRRRDSWVFQNQTVRQVLEEIFSDYQSAGALAPAWRWDLLDETVYPQRSLCIQYQESDLEFVQRLMLEEGLFCWFEHAGAVDTPSLGTHTLVIADHNGAFDAAGAAPPIRFTQSSAVLPEDSLVEWEDADGVRAASLALASHDYRTVGLRPVAATGVSPRGVDSLESLAQNDHPGTYAYPEESDGERLAGRRMQALDASRESCRAAGSVRTLGPGSRFTLTDHPHHDGSDGGRDEFVVLRVRHRARNNVEADVRANVPGLAESFETVTAEGRPTLANETDEPLYRCELVVQRAAVPVRFAALDEFGLPDVRAHRRSRIDGAQTALVVGLDGPVHTDRDHRVKIQFHWQRGQNSSHRLAASGASNAPADDASGTWVRVSETVAGPNWGGHFVPRLGQEVVVAFVQGDIDRPIVVGAVYNGEGESDAQSNRVGAGNAGATGNAPAWFVGKQNLRDLQAHQHPAVLNGFKSQELASSADGHGGYNQLVFDSSTQAVRLELASTSAGSRLQLGSLLQQEDNRRLQPRGHGADLSAAAGGSLRAGSGMLVSAHRRSASTGSARQIDAREALSLLQEEQALIHAVAENAQAQKAMANHEADIAGATEKDSDRHLPVERGLYASRLTLSATDQRRAD